LKLSEVTRKVIASLEEKSGYIVKVTKDPSLPTLATFFGLPGETFLRIFFRTSTARRMNSRILWSVGSVCLLCGCMNVLRINAFLVPVVRKVNGL